MPSNLPFLCKEDKCRASESVQWMMIAHCLYGVWAAQTAMEGHSEGNVKNNNKTFPVIAVPQPQVLPAKVQQANMLPVKDQRAKMFPAKAPPAKILPVKVLQAKILPARALLDKTLPAQVQLVNLIQAKVLRARTNHVLSMMTAHCHCGVWDAQTAMEDHSGEHVRKTNWTRLHLGALAPHLYLQSLCQKTRVV